MNLNLSMLCDFLATLPLLSEWPQEFSFQTDPPRCAVSSARFPSLEQALAVPWKDLVKRHFPLSEIFVRSRVVHNFRFVLAGAVCVCVCVSECVYYAC
jgi:hypothetical protein